MNTRANIPITPDLSSPSPVDRASPLSQAKVVGAVSMALASLFLLATAVLLLSFWIPAWTATLGLSVLLTALSLASFASADPRSPLRSLDFQRRSTPPESLEASASSYSGEPVATTADLHPVRAVEAPEYDDATSLSDDQETTAVRHVAALLNTRQRSAPSNVRPTDPMFPRATRPSVAGG